MGHLRRYGYDAFFRAFVLFTPADGDGLVVLSNCVAGLELMDGLVQAYDGREHRLFRSPMLQPGD